MHILCPGRHCSRRITGTASDVPATLTVHRLHACTRTHARTESVSWRPSTGGRGGCPATHERREDHGAWLAGRTGASARPCLCRSTHTSTDVRFLETTEPPQRLRTHATALADSRTAPLHTPGPTARTRRQPPEDTRLAIGRAAGRAVPAAWLRAPRGQGEGGGAGTSGRPASGIGPLPPADRVSGRPFLAGWLFTSSWRHLGGRCRLRRLRVRLCPDAGPPPSGSPPALPEAALHPMLRLLAEGSSRGPRAAPRQRTMRPALCPVWVFGVPLAVPLRAPRAVPGRHRHQATRHAVLLGGSRTLSSCLDQALDASSGVWGHFQDLHGDRNSGFVLEASDAQTADSDSDTSRSVRPPGRPRSRCPPRCLWFVGSARQRWDREPPSRHGYTGHSCTVGGQGQGCCSHSRPACLVANRPVRTARATGVADHVTASGSTLRAWPRTMQGPTSPASTPKGPQTASRTAPSAAT